MEEKLLNIEEVARYLNLSEEKVRELVEKGELPAYKIGGVILRFKKEQIEGYSRRDDSAVSKRTISSYEREVKSKRETKNTYRKRFGAGRDNLSGQVDATYTFWERLGDFLYYYDFYIVSFILLILIVLAVFGS